MRPISKDTTKHYQIACSSGELHAICILGAHVFHVLILPFFTAFFATRVLQARTSGGGGTSNDMPWRDKDEDYLHWTYRAMRYAHAKHYPGNKLCKNKSY